MFAQQIERSSYSVPGSVLHLGPSCEDDRVDECQLLAPCLLTLDTSLAGLEG